MRCKKNNDQKAKAVDPFVHVIILEVRQLTLSTSIGANAALRCLSGSGAARRRDAATVQRVGSSPHRGGRGGSADA
jgi:hypothetical protein